MDIKEILSESQINCIVNIIRDRCRLFHEKNEDLYYNPYVIMRKQHALTGAVLTGFAPMNMQIEGLASRDVNYGPQNKMCQPELYNENAVFQIYSNKANIEKNNLVRTKCEQLNRDIENTKPNFYIIRFKTNGSDQLVGLTLLLPNKDVQIIDEYEIPIMQY